MVSTQISTYSDVITFLEGRLSNKKQFSGKVGLNRVLAVLARLGNPETKFRTIHIAGTSGKGSTASFIAQLLIDSGRTCGLHLSPYLLDIRERIQVNGELISREVFRKNLEKILPAILETDQVYGELTYFEILTVLCFYSFAESQVGWAVIETGLGGLLDATNAITRKDKIAVITRIGLDHQRLLGSTIAEIAWQKAGIIHPGNLVVRFSQGEEVDGVISKKISLVGASDCCIEPPNGSVTANRTILEVNGMELPLGLQGAHQLENAQLALQAVKLVHGNLNLDLAAKSLSKTKIRGRFEQGEVSGHQIILDGAHNPQKMSSLIESLKLIHPDKKFTVLFSANPNKDFIEMINLLIPLAARFIVLPFKRPQDQEFDFNSAARSLALAKSAGVDASLATSDTMAVEWALERNDPILVTGSIYSVGRLIPVLEKKGYRHYGYTS